MAKIKELFTKLKGIKNLQLYIALILTLVVVGIVFLGDSQQISTQKVEIDQSYIQQMESKIVNVLQDIDGVGEVSVAVSYSTEMQKVYAYQTTSKGDGSSVVETVVTVKGEPLVVTTLAPKILGVVVVAEGGDDPVIKYKIKQVVVTLLDVSVSNVQVFSYKS